MSIKHMVFSVLVGVAVTSVAVPASADPSQLTAEWYTINWGHDDTEKSIDGLKLGLVESALGPNGLPVRSAVSAGAPATSSNNIVDVNGNNEILWWAAGTRTGIGTVSVDSFYSSLLTLPVNQPSNLFPGGSGSNGNPNGYVAAHLYGTFFAPSDGDIVLTLGADDDAWVFINGTLVVDLGGVKALTPAPTTVAGLTGGQSYTIDLFFADRHVVQSGLVFSADVNFRADPDNGVPEPASLALLSAGLLGLGLVRRRRLN